MGRIFFIILTSTLIYFHTSTAQTDTLSVLKDRFKPSANLYSGIIIKNFPGVPDGFFANYLSVNYSFQTFGNRPWHGFYGFPKIGIENVFGVFNSPELGCVIGVVPNMEIRTPKNYIFKFGLGASYFNKPFDLITNNTNYYIGYPFTNMTILSVGHQSKLNNKLSLNYGFTSLHCSDGHTSLPNAGINCLLVNVGLTGTVPARARIRSVRNDSLRTKPVYSLRFGLGLHEFGETTKAVGGPSYPSYHYGVYVTKPYKDIHMVEGGIIWSYYTSFHDYIVNQEVYKDKINLRSSTGVVFLGHEFIFGKIGFSTQLGIYFYNPFFIQQKKIDGSWSSFGERIEAFNTNRVGLIYYPFKKRNSLNTVNNQLMIGAYIKANLGQADMFEYIVGYRF